MNVDAPEFKQSAPACQIYPDTRKDIRNKKCQAVLLDKTGRKILIVYENVPKELTHLQRWGLPKGKFKEGEVLEECVHREVCEEVGINVGDYPHVYRKQGRNHIVTFNKAADEIHLHLGPEIARAEWVDLDWLKSDVSRDISNQKRYGTRYIAKYNAPLKKVILTF